MSPAFKINVFKDIFWSFAIIGHIWSSCQICSPPRGPPVDMAWEAASSGLWGVEARPPFSGSGQIPGGHLTLFSITPYIDSGPRPIFGSTFKMYTESSHFSHCHHPVPVMIGYGNSFPSSTLTPII